MQHAAEFPLCFPVPVAVFPEELRQAVRDFYGYIASLQEICGQTGLPREEKRQQLRLLRLSLQENELELLPDWALGYHVLREQGRLSPLHGEQIWQGFWQDTEKDRYLTIEEVVAYATLVNASIGRAVMEIAGESEIDRTALDAFCIALQMIAQLQQMRADYLLRQRVYLPRHWLEEAGLSDRVLAKKETGPKLRGVLNLWLDEVETQLRRAGDLPASIRRKAVKREIRYLLSCQIELARKLRQYDPMKFRINLSRSERFTARVVSLIF